MGLITKTDKNIISTPIEDVSTEVALTAKCVAANVGKPYRFTGSGSSLYVTGDIYIVGYFETLYPGLG